MNPEAELRDHVNITVEDIGGIDETSVTFDPGVTLLVGRNATNRTSLLQAIMAACGSESVSLKADAEEAHVEMTMGEETYTRHLRRQDDTVAFDGEPYLDDAEVADLFAFLLGTNEARQAVTQSAELRELVMRPVDTDAIQADIDRRTEQKREVEAQLEELATLEDRLPRLEEKRARLDEEMADLQADLDETQAELEHTEADVEATREEEAELEDRLDELRDKRAVLDDVRYDIQTAEEVIADLRDEREELRATLEEHPDPDDDRADDLEADIERLRDRKRTLETEIDELQSVVQFNERMLEEQQETVVQALTDNGAEEPDTDEDATAVTDQLVADEATTCWTCGSEVAVEEIQSTLDQLRDVNQTRFARIDEIETELREHQETVQEIKEQRQQRRKAERRLSDLESDLESRTGRLDTLGDRRSALEEEISTLESEVESLEETVQTEVLELHKEANDLEFELGKLEREREDVVEEIASIEERLAERDQLEAQRDEIQAEVEDLRTKIEQLDRQAIEAFNDHMATLLDRLEYENVDRIWLERVERQVREGRRTVTKPAFELHVIRTTESGTTYEDTIDHLSESEREVTGLVFALAGYLAHEVHEEVPVMLLDSLDPIDADRIATLVEYLTDVAEYLVVALLEEDAAAFDESATRITDI